MHVCKAREREGEVGRGGEERSGEIEVSSYRDTNPVGLGPHPFDFT